MSYDGTPDAVFNPGGESLPSASELFKELELERGYSLPYGNPRFEHSATGGSDGGETAQSFGRETGVFYQSDAQGRAHRARVAHLPQPAQKAEEFPPLYPNSTERDIAEELLAPETFDWWKARNDLADKGRLPDIPRIYHRGVQRKQTASAANKAKLEWEDLSLGIRWIILLRLSEKHSFGIAVVSQLKLHKHQVHDFISSYINFCDQWNAFENTVFQRSLALKGCGETRDRLLINWLHEKRPQLPTDRITTEDIHMGLRFLDERGVFDHNVDFQEWINEKDTKDFAQLKIDGPIMRDCMDHRLLRRAAAAKLLPLQEIEDAVRQHGRENRRSGHGAHVRNVMINDALLGTLQDIVPFEDGYWHDNDVPLSPEAQAVLDTISADLRIGEPMPMPIPPYQRQQKREEAVRALRHMVPELRPQHIPGSLVKTQWEIDNGYPMGYPTNYTPLDLDDYAADMQYVPEAQTKAKTCHGPAGLQVIVDQQPAARVSGSSTVQEPDRSAGRRSDRYENSSSICSSAAPFHSPAAFAAALAGGYNASRPRIGAARARFMTSNDKGQLMVGMAADVPSVAGQVPQNPGCPRPLAGERCRGQPEVSRRAAEAEPENIPFLRPAEDSEPDSNLMSERSKRTRRPSARARESLQYALEMGQSTEIIPEKPRGRKARPSRSRKKQPDEGAQSESEPTEEDGAQAATAAPAKAKAAVVTPLAQTAGSLNHSSNAITQADSVHPVDETPRPEVNLKRQLPFEEPDQSGSEVPAAHGAQQKPARKRASAAQRSDKFFGMFKSQELNACPPPVSAIRCAWSADVAGFAVEAVQACYALKADRVNPNSLVPRHLQMDRDTIQATLASMEAEYARMERQLRGETGPNAERAEFAGVTDSATFAIHATEASVALENAEADSEHGLAHETQGFSGF